MAVSRRELFKWVAKTPEELAAQRRIRDAESHLAAGKRLRRADEQQFEKDRLLINEANTRIQRGRIGVAVVGGAILTGTSALGLELFRRFDNDVVIPTPVTQFTDFEKRDNPPDARGELMSKIHDLPKSPIKELLESRITPYFGDQVPKRSLISGFSFPVFTTEVNQTYNTSQRATNGDNTIRKSLPLDDVYVTQQQRLRAPYPYLIKADDRKRFPDDAFYGDIPVFTIDYPAGHVFTYGVAPQINIDYPRPENIPSHLKARIQADVAFVYLKEAASLLLQHLFIEQMVGISMKADYPTEVTLQNKNGKEFQGEVYHSLFANLINRSGRLTAAVDAGGIVVALKAMEGTQAISELSGDFHLGPILRNMPNLGNTAESVLKRAFNWAVNYPQVKTLPIAGNIDLIP